MIDRAALTAYLATEYDTLLAEAGIAATDTADGLAPVLDAVDTLVSLSPDLSPVWVQPLGRYYALSRIVNRFAANMDVSTGGDTYRLQQQFANAKALLDRERAGVLWLVEPIPPDTSGVGSVVTIEMPYLTEAESWQ